MHYKPFNVEVLRLASEFELSCEIELGLFSNFDLLGAGLWRRESSANSNDVSFGKDFPEASSFSLEFSSSGFISTLEVRFLLEPILPLFPTSELSLFSGPLGLGRLSINI